MGTMHEPSLLAEPEARLQAAANQLETDMERGRHQRLADADTLSKDLGLSKRQAQRQDAIRAAQVGR